MTARANGVARPPESRAGAAPDAPFGPELFINRELSWLEFNQRVLEEARDPRVPLLERLKFLLITQNNLDEFVMVRLAGVVEQRNEGVMDVPADGMTPAEQVEAIAARLERMYDEMADTFVGQLLPRLEAEGITLTKPSALPKDERERLRN
ncbi:MAG: RNA degradosome polyphosphate kinase, partial [Myxococcota bacterium]